MPTQALRDVMLRGASTLPGVALEHNSSQQIDVDTRVESRNSEAKANLSRLRQARCLIHPQRETGAGNRVGAAVADEVVAEPAAADRANGDQAIVRIE